MKLMLSLFGISLFLTACAVNQGSQTAEQARAQLAQATNTCTSLNQAVILDLPLTPLETELAASSQIYTFNDGKSYFSIYRLPLFKKPYSIYIRSHSDGSLTDSAIMLPRITLLDDGFKEKRQFNENALRNRASDVEQTVFINATNSDERYLLIRGANIEGMHTRKIGVMQTTPIMAGGLMFNFTSGGDAVAKIYTSPTGKYLLNTNGLVEPSIP